jgi:hypothetical protein
MPWNSPLIGSDRAVLSKRSGKCKVNIHPVPRVFGAQYLFYRKDKGNKNTRRSPRRSALSLSLREESFRELWEFRDEGTHRSWHSEQASAKVYIQRRARES